MFDMKKIVRKSAIPLYAVAITWLLYGLLFPLYRLPHFLLAIAATAVVGVVARCFCRDVVEEVPEEPKTTGNAELDKMLSEGEKAIAEMKQLDIDIADEAISAQIVRLQILAQRIFDHVEANPEKLKDIRRFMNYYLPTTLKVLRAYDVLEEQGLGVRDNVKKLEVVPATTKLTDLLKTNRYEPLILISALGRTAEQMPSEYSESYSPSSRNSFHIHVHR